MHDDPLRQTLVVAVSDLCHLVLWGYIQPAARRPPATNHPPCTSAIISMALLYADNRASFARAPPPTYFRLFTKESLTKIERRIRDERAARALVKQLQEQGDPAAAAAGPRDDLQPNPQLEAGKTLPARMGEFPPELYGKPIEELDEFYHNKYVSMSSTALADHGSS